MSKSKATSKKSITSSIRYIEAMEGEDQRNAFLGFISASQILGTDLSPWEKRLTTLKKKTGIRHNFSKKSP